MAKIRILKGDKTTQQLTLSDHGHSWVFKGNSIKWKIKDGSDVASIERMTLKPETINIFSDLPGRANADGRKWKAKVKSNAGDFDSCEYSIFWKATDGSGPYEHDPKISVMPSAVSPLPIVIAVISLVSLIFLFSKVSKR